MRSRASIGRFHRRTPVDSSIPKRSCGRGLAPESTVDAFAPVTLDAADLLTADNHDRLRTCPSCEWLFEDRTRNAQRRWCDMADCGSRDKARRYYQRSIQR
ncbi:MAG: CGNR zinc finger domain-containing protein [Burkholderiaceae bacterium]